MEEVCPICRNGPADFKFKMPAGIHFSGGREVWYETILYCGDSTCREALDREKRRTFKWFDSLEK